MMMSGVEFFFYYALVGVRCGSWEYFSGCGAGYFPYMYTAAMTSDAPHRNIPLSGVENRKTEMVDATMIDTEVAKPLRMLSAYRITTATRRPPQAWVRITTIVQFV
mmetsp:Transcript_7954/g.17422  ORF Transcript_7954/g.17422 Transcript_7954/m.17422 type:complete len:106 (+) Transcript_7954:70-387(+)